jgi:hypothetical protein
MGLARSEVAVHLSLAEASFTIAALGSAFVVEIFVFVALGLI